jgi:hypothetical protein
LGGAGEEGKGTHEQDGTREWMRRGGSMSRSPEGGGRSGEGLVSGGGIQEEEVEDEGEEEGDEETNHRRDQGMQIIEGTRG